MGGTKYFNLTCVAYEADDALVGKVAAVLSLLPVFLMWSFGTLWVFRRELHTLCYGCVVLLADACASFLKHRLVQPRPADAPAACGGKGYGMPSSHTACAFAFAVYGILHLVYRVQFSPAGEQARGRRGPKPAPPAPPLEAALDRAFKPLVSAALVLYAALVGWSRVHLRYHSAAQVAAGGCLGTAVAAVGFAFVGGVLQPYVFPRVLGTRAARYLCLRDSSHIHDILRYEASCSRAALKDALAHTD